MQGLGGGPTRIQVEPYESEGLSYELCRSERNPADSKKKNRLLEHSYTAARVLHRQAPQTPEEQKTKEADKAQS